MTTQVKKTSTDQPILIQQLVIKQTNRQSQDISSWRSAITSAEAVNSRRTQLYDLYLDILLDGHLSAVLDKRKNGVKNLPVSFIQDGKKVDDINQQLKGQWFKNMLADWLDSIFWGHTLTELTFGEKISYALVPRKHVNPILGQVMKEQTDTAGIPYRVDQYLNYIVEVGNPYDLGLLMKASQYVIYKRNGLGDWAQFAELFGMPFRIGKYDGQDEQSRMQLEQALDKAGSAAYAVIPKEASIEFVQNYANAGSNIIYDGIINACNDELSKLILGNTLTTEQGDKGARSLGEIHKDAEEIIHAADKIFILDILNTQFKKLLITHGYPAENGEFTFDEADEMDLKDKFMIDKELSNIIPIDDDYYYNTYNIPKPANYDQLKKEMKDTPSTTLPQFGKGDSNAAGFWKGFFESAKGFFR